MRAVISDNISRLGLWNPNYGSEEALVENNGNSL